MITVSAPGKIILFGEHAVVYGHPAIAVPLTAVQVTATVHRAAPGEGITISAPDVGLHVRVADSPDAAVGTPETAYNALIYPVRVALDALNLPIVDAALTVHSTIPVASGLGSGAAVAAALIRAVGELAGHPFDPATLNALVYEVEKRHHGTPSGIDNTVIVYEKPVYFQRLTPTEARMETFSITQPFTLIVADTGQASPTRLAVADVRALYEKEPDRIGAIFAQIGAIARAARQAIESGTLASLGPLLDQNHALLRDLAVSSESLDRLCQVAREAGAWGAKLSGGGRGGNLIALVAPGRVHTVCDALHAAGAVKAIQTTVG
jgi:mevalonate kinase